MSGASPRSTRALVAAIAITASAGLAAFLTGTLGVQIKADLGISDTGLGVAVAALFGSATFIAAPSGRWADRLGWQRAVQVVSAASAASLLGAAVFGGTLAGLVAFMLLGGIGFGMTTPASSLLIARTTPAHRRGLAFGIKQAAVPLSTLLAGLAVPVVALTVGWRWAFAAGVALPLLAVGLVGRPAPGVAADRRRRADDVVAFVTPRSLRVLAWAGALSAVSIGALHGFVVVSAVASGVSVATAGALVGVCSVIGIGVRVAAGWYIDRVPSDGFREIALMLALGGLGYALLATQTAALAAPGMLLAYTAGWGWPGLFQYGLIELFPGSPASASGVIQTGFAGGTAAGPLLFGVAADSVGYGWAWVGIAVSCGVAALLIDRAAARMRVAVTA